MVIDITKCFGCENNLALEPSNWYLLGLSKYWPPYSPYFAHTLRKVEMYGWNLDALNRSQIRRHAPPSLPGTSMSLVTRRKRFVNVPIVCVLQRRGSLRRGSLVLVEASAADATDV